MQTRSRPSLFTRFQQAVDFAPDEEDQADHEDRIDDDGGDDDVRCRRDWRDTQKHEQGEDGANESDAGEHQPRQSERHPAIGNHHARCFIGNGVFGGGFPHALLPIAGQPAPHL